MRLYSILSFFALAGAAYAASAPNQTPQPPTAQQELQAMRGICELAEYASRIEAEKPCQYFIEKYRSAAAAEAQKQAKKNKKN